MLLSTLDSKDLFMNFYPSCLLSDKMLKAFIAFVILLACLVFSVIGVPSQSRENFLDLIKLDDYPLAQCNDGTTAVYYRQES